MKKTIVLSLLLACCVMYVSGQTFDITGSYRGETEGMTVRIDVEPGDPDGFRFSFIAMEEASPVFVSDYAESGEYLFEEDGDLLQVKFEDGICRYTNGNRVFTFVKVWGEPLSHLGYYSYQVEENVELVLKVEGVDQQYTFAFEAWETETVLSAPGQTGNIFTLTSDWGETITLEFTPDRCIFSGENEGRIELKKKQ